MAPTATAPWAAAEAVAGVREALTAASTAKTDIKGAPRSSLDLLTEAGTIVVVEDDPNIADLLDMYLRQERFRVVQAADGEHGLEVVDRERPRLVVLDVTECLNNVRVPDPIDRRTTH